MHKKLSYRILIIGLRLGLGLMVSAELVNAQMPPPTSPTQADLYCSGVVTDQPIPTASYVISGENSRYKSTFFADDYIYINRGEAQGVKVGDEFDVVRAVSDRMASTAWFKYQTMLSRAMGTQYADIGRLRIVHVDEKTSTAQIDIGCYPVQRDDIVLPFVARPAPQFHDIKLDPFAPPSGKKTAMVVSTKDYSVLTASGRIIYVNLGSAQGVRVGDYFRVFRYQGTHIETVYQVRNTAYKAYGFGSTPVAYEWNNLPRQVLGEGIVLRLGPNSSTVMLTTVRMEIFAGDYVEVE
jgi:Flagellar assembly protein T, C-terminal domain